MKQILTIPASEAVTGMTVFCRKCRKDISDICLNTKKPIETCEFSNKHVYRVRVHIPGTTHGTERKQLKSRIFSEAVKEAKDFSDAVKERHEIDKMPVSSSAVEQSSCILESNIATRESQHAPTLLKDAIFRYIAFLHNEGVPYQYHVHREPKTLRDYKKDLRYLLESIEQEGYDLSTMPVTDFYSELLVGRIYTKLKRDYSKRTLKKRFTLYKAFELWLHENLEYPLSVKWKTVRLKNPVYHPQAVPKEQYFKLLKVVKPENGMGQIMHNRKLAWKNFYLPWLKDAFTLGAETGLRREELAELRFCDVIEEGNQKPYLKVKNIKVNKIKDLEHPEEWEYIPIPISHGCKELLKKLGIAEHRGSKRYILAPDKENRTAIMDILTRSFTHFYKLVDPAANLTFRNLRKTNLTYKRVMDRYNTTHSNDRVLKEHYEDRVIIARNLFGYKLFPDDEKADENINFWA